MKKFVLISLLVLLVFSMTGCSFIDKFVIGLNFEVLCVYIVDGNLDEIVLLHTADVQDDAEVFYNNILNTIDLTKFEDQNTQIAINGKNAILTTDIAWAGYDSAEEFKEGIMEGLEFSLIKMGFMDWQFNQAGW